MHFLLTLLTLASAGVGTASAHQLADHESKPNVIVIMTDDQGWGDFGFHGNPVLATPSLDRLAEQAVRIEQFYVHPVCTPTRSALMTGRYPQRTRAFDTYIGRAMMEPDEVTMAEVFGAAGWATGIFGKWHLGDCYPMRSMDQGFDESLVHRGGGIGQPSDPEGAERKYTDAVLFHNGKRVQTKGYCTDVYFDAGIAWMREQHKAGQPFLMYLPTNAPHGPFHDVPEDLYRKYAEMDLSPAVKSPEVGHAVPKEFPADRLARIFAMIENVDQNVGKLDAALHELGIADNTIVIYLNDNGPNTRRHVGGRRGQKSSVYEGGVRSPLWWRWPAKLKAKDAGGFVAANIDVLPTLIEACGIELEEDLAMDGRSMLAAMGEHRGKLQKRKLPLVIQAQRGDQGVRYHNFLLRTDRWKLVNASGFGREVEKVEPKFELYDMSVDPLELKNVADQNADVVAQLQKQYNRWFDDVSSTRTDNWAPPAIDIGADASPDVTLTRQDWRKLQSSGWSPHSQGQWWIDTVHEGPYSIRIRFLPKSEVNHVDLFCGDFQLSKGVKAGESEITLHGVELPQGRNWLRFDLAVPGEIIGPYQVEIHRVDPKNKQLGGSGPEWVRQDSKFQYAIRRGDFDGAWQASFRMLDQSIHHSGFGHRDVIYSLNRAAEFLAKANLAEDSTRMIAFTHKAYQRILGCNHSEALYYQGLLLKKRAAPPHEIAKVYEQALAAMIRESEADHLGRLYGSIHLAGLYDVLGEEKKMEQALTQATDALAKVQEDHWYQEAALLSTTAVIHFTRGRMNKCIEETLKCKALYSRNSLPHSFKIADVSLTLGFLYLKTGELSKANAELKEAMQILEQLFGKDCRKYVEAKRFLDQVLALEEEQSF